MKLGGAIQEMKRVTITMSALRLKRPRIAAAFAALALAFAANGAAPAFAQDVPKGMHGDWETRCGKPPGAQEEVCSIRQYVSAEDRENVGLVVYALKTVDKKAQILRVIAPLGVYLKRGVDVSVGTPVSFKTSLAAGTKPGTATLTIPDNLDVKQGDILVRADTNEFLRVVAIADHSATVPWKGDTGKDIQINQIYQNLGAIGFDTCQQAYGCIADVDLSQQVLDMLRKGTTALFYFYQSPEEGFGVPVSLKGFGAGFDALP